jgi:hypothetical protein
MIGPPIRADIHARFRRVVAQAIERSDREHKEHLARLRAKPYERGTLRNYPTRQKAPPD